LDNEDFFASCTKEELTVYINTFKENSKIKTLDLFISILIGMETIFITINSSFISIILGLFGKNKSYELVLRDQMSLQFGIIVVGTVVLVIIIFFLFRSRSGCIRKDEEILNMMKRELHKKYSSEKII